MATQVQKTFSNFFDKWMSELEEYVQLRREKSDELNYESLVNKLTSHHKAYFTAKWAGAREDVLAFFTPVWLSTSENAYQWITGWKPSMVFRLVDLLRKCQVPSATTLADLTEEQLKKIDGLRIRIRTEERKVESEMERQQVAMADRKIVELTRMVSSINNREQPNASNKIDELVGMALKGLFASLEKVMKMADCVRLMTLKGILDVLNPVQGVNLLTSLSMLQIHMRKWGKKRENRCMNEMGN